MDCREARALLDPYADGELPLERSVELERHLADCPTCPGELEAVRSMGAALRERLPYHAAPPELHRRVRAGLARIDGAMARGSPPQWLRLAASFFLVAAMSSALTYYVAPRAGGGLPEEVFASHVRGLLSGDRLIDVASSDEHTVKPWFDTRLDFSPPVKDLTTEGFPLVGGRVDYVGGRNVAALVYHHKKHVITLFIWPATARSAGIETRVRHGDNLAYWSDGSMTYWAVSDLNAAELVAFCRMLGGIEAAPAPASAAPKLQQGS